jgi:hypothetical protein
MVKKRPPPPKPPKEFARFKEFLRRIVAVPKKEVDKEIAALREQKRGPEPET